jgi:hypothetical protein
MLDRERPTTLSEAAPPSPRPRSCLSADRDQSKPSRTWAGTFPHSGGANRDAAEVHECRPFREGYCATNRQAFSSAALIERSKMELLHHIRKACPPAAVTSFHGLIVYTSKSTRPATSSSLVFIGSMQARAFTQFDVSPLADSSRLRRFVSVWRLRWQFASINKCSFN